MAIFGYARVSSLNQNDDRQMIAMSELGISQERVFTDKQSGKDFERPAWKSLLRKLKPGDLLYVKSIDRLGRNYDDILAQWRILTQERCVDIVVIDMPVLDTRRGKDLLGTLIADIVLNLLSFVAQNERESIRQRRAEGIAAAKARGVRFGRPIIKPPEDFGVLVKLWERGKLPLQKLLEQTDLKIATFYRRLRELRAAGKRNAAIKKPPDDIDIPSERNHPEEIAEIPQAAATDIVGMNQFENSHVLQVFPEMPGGEKKKSRYQKVPLKFRYSCKAARVRQAAFCGGG